LITAQFALEQGREVFAIPGSIHNPQARGCHWLIRQGAKLVETATDVLEEIGPLLQQPIATSAANHAVPPPKRSTTAKPAVSTLELDEQYQKLLQQIGMESATVDALVERCGLTADVVSSMLLILELHGYVAAKPGGFYFRVATEGE